GFFTIPTSHPFTNPSLHHLLPSLPLFLFQLQEPHEPYLPQLQSHPSFPSCHPNLPCAASLQVRHLPLFLTLQGRLWPCNKAAQVGRLALGDGGGCCLPSSHDFFPVFSTVFVVASCSSLKLRHITLHFKSHVTFSVSLFFLKFQLMSLYTVYILKEPAAAATQSTQNLTIKKRTCVTGFFHDQQN
ncbi:hypothetical protein LINGRAHAP2_LOCUS10014, partial [Linum grandiflorum]